jgi:hypothetical protein
VENQYSFEAWMFSPSERLFPEFLAAAGDGYDLVVGEEPKYGNMAITAPVPDPDDSNLNLSTASRIHAQFPQFLRVKA